jgi:prolyl oligopeptidase
MRETIRPIYGPALLASGLVLSLGVLPSCAPAPAASAPAPDARSTQVQYPETQKVSQTDDYHGTTVADPYRWLEDVGSPETKAWVEAQNKVTFGYLETLPQREAIKERLTELWDYPKYGTPWREGGRTFWFENSGLQNQSVLYVQDAPGAEQRVLLDPNRLSDDGTVALNALSVSPDGKLLGYGTSVSGSDWQTFHVRDVATGQDLADTLRWIKFSGFDWTGDNKGFFYGRYPENSLTGQNTNQALYYHRLGTPQSEDRLIMKSDENPFWSFGAQVTDDGRYALIYQREGTDDRSRVYVVDLGDPMNPNVTAAPVPLFPDFDASYGVIGNQGSTFYVVTDKDAPRQRVIAVDLKSPAQANWKTIIPEGKDALRSVDIIGDRFVASYLQDARSDVRLFSMNGEPMGSLTLPGLGSVSGIRGERDDKDFFYTFTSFLYPPTVFRYDLTTGQSTVHKAPEIAFDTDQYVTEQVFYTSKDGTRVPMFVTHKKGIQLDGTNPTLLYGYGGFNVTQTPGFSAARLVWLEMGGVYAVANLRGGGEYGKEWHEAGTKERKQNVFDDFIAAAEYLIEQGYTQPSKLAIQGGSNGGLLVGAVMNQRPELFGVAFPAVGVMDMLRFHKFTIGRGWTPDYGSSDDPEGFEYLYAYSPLHNLQPGTCYPATMVTTADHDDRVVPGHSFKYAATLQAAQGCANPTLIRVETKAGHGAGKPTSKQIEEVADLYGFAAKHLEMQPLQ